ncbi:MAG: hypothetical protein KIT22_06325 [Verrucomicrobiae bacterium]|nr:hypothetical protein [Verrucomicrobiae bacterium]
MSSVEKRWEPFRGIRRPLKVSVLALESGTHRVAICSLDVLGFASEAVYGWERFVSSIARQSGEVAPGEILIAATHTHSAPETLALSGSFETEAYRQWLASLETQLGTCIKHAFSRLRPAEVGMASGRTEGLTLYRRIKTSQGIRLSSTFARLERHQLEARPTDERVRCLVLRDAANHAPVAFVVHGVCHPVYEMCHADVSPDFPGELRDLVKSRVASVPVLFLNGAAGTINPWHVSSGAAFAQRHAETMFRAIEPALAAPRWIPVPTWSLKRSTVSFPCRPVPGDSLPERVPAEISLLTFPGLGLLFLPGEPFLETALQIEKQSPFAETIVAGFSACSVGYIPTPEAFREGGYEVGPGRWSYLASDAESRLRDEVARLFATVGGA